MPGGRKYVAAAIAVVSVVALYNLLKSRIRQNRSHLSYVIKKMWDSKDVSHESKVCIQLSRGPNKSIKMSVTAPFFNSPSAPKGEKGQPFPQLWDYEVVEAFFLSDSGKYLEVELCPHGQHLVLMLNGRRSIVKDKLPLEFESTIKVDQWQGVATIPADYLPPNVTKFNAYAIHGTDKDRQYEALYPVPAGKHEEPDFHRLEYFERIDLGAILAENRDTEYKSVHWTN